MPVMKIKHLAIISLMVTAVLAASCGKSGSTTAASRRAATPIGSFDRDSAYRFVEEQVAFGPRAPGTAAHDSCADYIISKLQQYELDTILIQRGTVTAYDGSTLPITNIIAGNKPNVRHRVALAAHYDTRAWADRESDDNLRAQPILGANDGASGVAVLLEIARNIQLREPEIGVDLLFFDAEDQGAPDEPGGHSGGWCLGSQYWLEHREPYRSDNLPAYGILLDMVGGRNARFYYDLYSQENAQTACIKVWGEADALGYGHIFVRRLGGSVLDDHVFMTNRGIPTADVIELYNETTGSFPPYWHTHDDDMRNISRTTLDAVGKTVLNVLYKEHP